MFLLKGNDKGCSVSRRTGAMGSSCVQQWCADSGKREAWDMLSCQAAEMGETEGNMGRQLWARGSPAQILRVMYIFAISYHGYE